MEFGELDFSIFHPLDHRPGSRRCREFYGGWKHHVKLSWQYEWRERLTWPVQRIVLCPIGRHNWLVWYGPDGKVQPTCNACDTRRPPTAKELEGP